MSFFFFNKYTSKIDNIATDPRTVTTIVIFVGSNSPDARKSFAATATSPVTFIMLKKVPVRGCTALSVLYYGWFELFPRDVEAKAEAEVGSGGWKRKQKLETEAVKAEAGKGYRFRFHFCLFISNV